MEKQIEIKISDLGKIVTGNTPVSTDPTNYGGKYPFIKPTDMVKDKKNVFIYEQTYSEKSYKKFIKSYISKGSTCVVTIGTVGEKMFQAHENCFTNQSVNSIIPNKEKYDEDYVYYLLKYNLNKVANANPGTASGRDHVSKSNFSSIKIKVFKNLNIQKKISQLLCNYDDLISLNEKKIDLLHRSLISHYKNWITNNEINNNLISKEQIRSIPLKEMIDFYINGGWGNERLNKNFNKKAFVIRGTDIPDIFKGNFFRTPLRYHKNSNLDSRQLEIGDICIEMSNGNFNNVGRSLFFDSGLKSIYSVGCMCASFCKMIRPKNLDFSYLIYVHIKYIHETGLMNVYKSQGANGINNFNFEEMINKESINVSIGDDVTKLSIILKNILSEQSNLRIQIKNLKKIRNIVLSQLMESKININNFNI